MREINRAGRARARIAVQWNLYRPVMNAKLPSRYLWSTRCWNSDERRISVIYRPCYTLINVGSYIGDAKRPLDWFNDDGGSFIRVCWPRARIIWPQNDIIILLSQAINDIHCAAVHPLHICTTIEQKKKKKTFSKKSIVVFYKTKKNTRFFRESRCYCSANVKKLCINYKFNFYTNFVFDVDAALFYEIYLRAPVFYSQHYIIEKYSDNKSSLLHFGDDTSYLAIKCQSARRWVLFVPHRRCNLKRRKNNNRVCYCYYVARCERSNMKIRGSESWNEFAVSPLEWQVI